MVVSISLVCIAIDSTNLYTDTVVLAAEHSICFSKQINSIHNSEVSVFMPNGTLPY